MSLTCRRWGGIGGGVLIGGYVHRLKGYRAILERQKSGLEGKISVLQEKRAEENT